MYLYFYKVPVQRLVLFQASDVECSHHPYKLQALTEEPHQYTSFHYPMIKLSAYYSSSLVLDSSNAAPQIHLAWFAPAVPPIISDHTKKYLKSN